MRDENRAHVLADDKIAFPMANMAIRLCNAASDTPQAILCLIRCGLVGR